MSFARALATCTILLLLLRAPFAEGESSEATSEAFMMEQILSENGCGDFAGLVAATTAAGEAFRAQVAGDSGGTGLTIFCPDDEAVAAFGPGMFNNLSADAQVALLLYHGVATLYSEEALRVFDSDKKVATLANGPLHYDIYILGGAGMPLILSSSRNAAFVTKMVVDNDLLAVYLIDSVLVPGEWTVSALSSHWKLFLLVMVCIVFGPVALVLLLIGLVHLACGLIKWCQDCATACVSAGRVAPQG